MEEMMALFTPPGRETKTKPRKLELHPYYKRPGKLVSNPKQWYLYWFDWNIATEKLELQSNLFRLGEILLGKLTESNV